MDRSGGRKQVRLTVYANEPLARLAQQRLQQEGIPCLIRCQGDGPAGLGVATVPYAMYVKGGDEMRARQVLDLAPAEIAEREGWPPNPAYRQSTPVLLIILMAAAALIVLQLVVSRLFN